MKLACRERQGRLARRVLGGESFTIRSRAYVRERNTSPLLNAPQQTLIPGQHMGE